MSHNAHVPQSQASEVNYALQTLGWKAFQDLCGTILSAVLGQTVSQFSPSGDGGRDAAFHGRWVDTPSDSGEQSYTAQCKFTSHSDRTLSINVLKGEFEKATDLAAQRLADRYILLTNYTLTGAVEASIRSAFCQIQGIQQCHVFGREWITQKIRESPRLRALVPRVYGLGDLSEIFDQRAYEQAQAILETMELTKLVVTDAYRKSVDTLNDHGFVLLIGEPAAGKSTIAAGLAVSSVDIWGSRVLKVRNAHDFVEHWNRLEPNQFFWIDDAFGTTQYQRTNVEEWNSALPHLTGAIRKGSKVVFTSRDYIYLAAKSDLKASAFPLLQHSQVVVNVKDLTLQEKEAILYNHIKMGNQPKGLRTALKPYLHQVAEHLAFIPETARRLGDSLFTINLQVSKSGVESFVTQAGEYLLDVLQALGSENESCLHFLFMHGGHLGSPISLSSQDETWLARLGSSEADLRKALAHMEGSIVRLITVEGKREWTFRHPTIRDAVASIVSRDPELVEVYLRGVKPEEFVREVSCGDLGIAGVKVIVTSDMFEVVGNGLDELLYGDRRNLGLVLEFLSRRCSKQFLKEFMPQHPDLMERICYPGSYLCAVSEVPLTERLYRLGLLPEEQRIKYFQHIKALAIETPDPGFLTLDSVRDLLKDEEVEEILSEIASNLEILLDEWWDIFRHNEQHDRGLAESYDPLIETLDVYQQHIKDENTSLLFAKIRSKIQERIADDSYDPPSERQSFSVAQQSITLGNRSIFEDVDV